MLKMSYGKNIILENNSYLEKFFSHLKMDKKSVCEIICENTKTFINQAPHKIKQVKGYKCKDKTIYEYKQNYLSKLTVGVYF
ncbi:hypothetical protein H2277_03850 [Campylobacter sp. W0014]|uniref:hypothetical protein n=1 Tax=Campylobacter sp. W0014 TaxID=2735781 RepID=UPI001EB46CF5|nr:hypothetical protein [Campylobacter sp. W0014]